MKKRVLLYLILVLAFFSLFAFLNQDRSITGFVAKQEVPINAGALRAEYPSKADPEVFERLEDNNTAEVIVHYNRPEKKSSLRKIVSPQKTVSRLSENVDTQELAAILEDPEVAYVEPERYFDIDLYDSVNITQASTAWNKQISGENLTGQGQTICVIDTGIDFTHPDLEGKNLLGCNLYCYRQSCQLDCSETDLNGHGTHVAGIAAANGEIKGIAPGANLIGLKVFPGNTGTSTTTSSLTNAIDWCVDHSDEYNISVITMSISSTQTYGACCDNFYYSFTNSISRAFTDNISVVASTGNTYSTNGIGAPSCICRAIAVSATNKDDTTASYGNFAKNNLLELLAPGTGILSTCAGGGYCEKTGTSMSAPMVAGALSILNQFYTTNQQSRSPEDLENILADTGKSISHPTAKYSRIDVDNALLSLDSIPPSVSLDSPENNLVYPDDSFNFTCSTSDWQLASIDLYVWDLDTGELSQASYNHASGTNFSLSVPANLSSGSYLWNCFASDEKDNSAFAPENFSLALGGASISLDYPENDSYISSAQLNCSALLGEGDSVNNLTLYVWNDSLSYVNSSSVSAVSFRPTLSDGFYSWNCLVETSGGFTASAPQNNTFTLDSVAPSLSLSSPVSDLTINSSDQLPVVFQFNTSDANNYSCYLIANSQVLNSTSQLSGASSNMLTYNFSTGDYAWQISCTDLANNTDSTSSQMIYVEDFGTNEIPGDTGGDTTGGGGGSGGGGGGGGGSFSPPVTSQQTNESNSSGADSTSNLPSTPPEDNSTQVGNTITGRAVDDAESPLNPWMIAVAVLVIIIIVLVILLVRKRRSNKNTKK